ncbi:hypothetical protein ACVIGA_005564 [Bradyrhizobium sp. USDA 3240]|uniref:hypothetical protein n=1 Tax=Bradyrhizobium sp. 41S5 TaxID=1404443 RepID=UPI0035302D7C
MAQGQRIEEFGGRVIYALDELKELKARADLAVRASNSDPGEGIVTAGQESPKAAPYARQESR